MESLESSFQQNLNHDLTIGIVTTVIESNGSTSLAQVANTYSLYQGVGSSGLQLRFGSAAVTTGQFGAWTPVGAKQVGTGYQVAWQFGTADQYIVWNVDSTGNFLSQGAVVSGISLALESLESTFPAGPQPRLGDRYRHDGDRVEWLDQPGSGGEYLFPVPRAVESSGPQLRFGGAAVTTGEFGAWTPIGAEQTASGYQVAWKFGSADQYVVWTTDISGNYLSQSAVVSGNSLALESLEAGFQQDLNGDLTTGIVTTVIELHGSTSLVQVANNYFLYPAGGSSGPELSAFGAPVVAWRIWSVQPDCRGSDGQRL